MAQHKKRKNKTYSEKLRKWVKELFLTPHPNNPSKQKYSIPEILREVKQSKKINLPRSTLQGWIEKEEWDKDFLHSTKMAVQTKEKFYSKNMDLSYLDSVAMEKARYFLQLDLQIRRAFERITKLFQNDILERDHINELNSLIKLVDTFHSIIDRRFEQDIKISDLSIRKEESKIKMDEIKAKTKVYESLIGDNTEYNEIKISMDSGLIARHKQETENA